MRRSLVPALVLSLLPLAASALPPDREAGPLRHFVLQSDTAIDAERSAALRAEGIDVEQPLANGRYLVRMKAGAAVPRGLAVRTYDASEKIARAAYAEAARGNAFARLSVLFHDETSFDDAQRSIEAVGGTIETPFDSALRHPQRLTVRVPSSAVLQLAADERVFGLYGPPRRPRPLNAAAALLSHVTPLFSAPYNLDGSGVVLAISDVGVVDAKHPEFGNRVTLHNTGSPASHPTHVAGTLIAAGINPVAKGMSPAATLHSFDVSDGDVDVPVLVHDSVIPTASVADNNSWDFGFSWQAGVWWGDPEALGAYDAIYSMPYDAVMRVTNSPLIVHAAGNDADQGHPTLTPPWYPHKHFNSDTGQNDSHTFCYSANGSGTDCPAPTCSTGKTYCELEKHPFHEEWATIGFLSSTKNSLAVGALNSDGTTIASFSSRGPTHDGRVKPEVVAKGVDQFSTLPNGAYGSKAGTSMAAPVVTGIAGIVTQQYRRTFGNTPAAPMLKTLLIAGVDDLGTPGPDYTFGFGRVNAQATVDLIRADNAAGSRIRTGSVSNGQDIDITLNVTSAQNLRVVLGWFDPEVLLVPNANDPNDDPLAEKTLVNDLDVRVVGPTGATVLPYVLDKDHVTNAATRAANHTDTTEMVEIANATPGTYHVIVHGAIGDSRMTAQDFVLVTNAAMATAPSTPRRRAAGH